MGLNPADSVNNLLQEVQQLKVRKVEYTRKNHDNTEAALMQSEIFRIFAIIDEVITSCYERTEKKWLDEEVSSMRRECAAEKSDLDEMVIIPSLTEEDQSLKAQAASTEIQIDQAIFRFACIALDKLYHLQSFIHVPDQADRLMNRPMLTAEFKKAYLLQRRTNSIGFNDMLLLSKKLEDYRNVIKTDFLECLRVNLNNVLSMDFNNVMEALEENDCLSLTPIPTIVNFHFKSNADFKRFNGSKKLREYGAQIWSCRLVFDWSGSQNTDLKCIKMIGNLFSVMPNLHHVEITLAQKVVQESMAINQLHEYKLPELPKLENLFVTCTRHASSRCAIAEKLLLDYAKTLKRVRMLPFSVQCGGFPKMERLEAENICFDTEEFSSYINMLIGSPLKYVEVNTLNINNGGIDTESILNLLKSVSLFGDTLTELKLKLYMPYEGIISLGSEIFSYSFPVVKTLVLQNFPVDLIILLQFPKLEHLTLSVKLTRHQRMGSGKQFLSALWDIEDFYMSDIWKMLPYLRKINVVKQYLGSNVRCSSLPPVKKMCITRKDCIAFQQNQYNFTVARLTVSDKIR